MTSDSSHRLRVALWGFHEYGSFGDDLSAGIVASHLQQKHGAEVVAHLLCAPYAERFGIIVADTVDDLIDGSDAVVFVGGSTLESTWPTGSRRVGMGANLGVHSADAARVLELASQRHIPLFGISIGGDGVYPRQLYPPSKETFLREARYIALRYADDVALLEQRGKRGESFPDILWQASRFAPAARAANDRLRIGINVYAGQLLPRRAFWLPPVLYAAGMRRRDVDFVFIDTANRSRGSFRALPRLPLIHGRNHMFQNPDDDLRLLASLDLMIATNLPVGIVAMSYGIPFFSIAPDHRARRLMRDIGLMPLCFDGRDAHRLWSLLSDHAALRDFRHNFRVPGLEELRRRSGGHLEALSRELEAI